jgi:hypothetical protein
MEKKSDYANSLAASSKPTAEERKISLALTRVGGDKLIQSLAAQAKEPGITPDEYDTIIRRIEARERAIFKNQGVKEIPTGVESTVQTATNAKGEVITSTDGGTTWKDAKGKIVK